MIINILLILYILSPLLVIIYTYSTIIDKSFYLIYFEELDEVLDRLDEP